MKGGGWRERDEGEGERQRRVTTLWQTVYERVLTLYKTGFCDITQRLFEKVVLKLNRHYVR